MFRRQVPDCRIQGRQRHRAVAVAAGLLVAHGAVPNPRRVQARAGLVEQGIGIGLQHPGQEAVA